MTTRRIGTVLLACGALLGLSLATTASAAEVDKLVEACNACHGKAGASTEKDMPSIGGNSLKYLDISMKAYKEKKWPCPETKILTGPKKDTKTDMCKVANDLSDSDMQEVNKYYSEQTFVRAKQTSDAALAAKGLEIHNKNCKKCHSEGGSAASDDSGILAGQQMGYLGTAFKAYAAGERPMPKKMKAKMDLVDKEGIEALINYYGSFK